MADPDPPAELQINVAVLAEAVRHNDLAKVRAIVRQQPQLVHVDMAGNNEHRSLHFAVLNHLPDMVRILMEAGADARKGIYPHREATSALTMAQERGYDQIVQIIEAEEQHRREALSCPNATVSPAQDQLNAAIRDADQEAVKTILDGDATLLKACDRDGKTPLHVAAKSLNEPIVALLLARGADMKRMDSGEQTPLERAARAVEWRRDGSVKQFGAVAQRLRQRGAEMNAAAAVALGDAQWIRRLHEEDPAAVSDPKAMLLTVAVNHERKLRGVWQRHDTPGTVRLCTHSAGRGGVAGRSGRAAEVDAIGLGVPLGRARVGGTADRARRRRGGGRSRAMGDAAGVGENEGARRYR